MFKNIIFIIQTMVISVVWITSSYAQSQTVCDYEKPIKAHPDGISKSYCGRQIAHVMGWQGAEWLERPERKQEERTDWLVELLKLPVGAHIADIGAGTGYLTRQLSSKVGAQGKVWAVDIQPQMVQFLQTVQKNSVNRNIEVRQSTLTSVNLPIQSIDAAIMVDVYHELEFPRETLQSLMASLKPGGRIYFVEYRANDINVPIKPLHTMTVDQIKKEAQASGFIFSTLIDQLPWQNVVVFSKP